MKKCIKTVLRKVIRTLKGEKDLTKEEIEHQVGHILDRYAELVSKDGAVEEGDTAVIDFKGFRRIWK